MAEEKKDDHGKETEDYFMKEMGFDFELIDATFETLTEMDKTLKKYNDEFIISEKQHRILNGILIDVHSALMDLLRTSYMLKNSRKDVRVAIVQSKRDSINAPKIRAEVEEFWSMERKILRINDDAKSFMEEMQKEYGGL